MLKLLPETIKNFFRKPATYKFPREDRPAHAEYRGMQEVDMNKCTGCTLCALDCPAYAIEMRLNPTTNKKYPVTDFGKCVFCYQCVNICPVKAYVTSNTYKLASFDKETLIRDAFKTSSESSDDRREKAIGN